MLPTLGRSGAPPIRPSCRSAPSPAGCCRCRRWSATSKGTIVFEDPTGARPNARHRRPCEDAVEARLGHALDGARRRLRDGRQGPDRERVKVSSKHLSRAGRHAARGFQLRAVPGHRGQEDFQVQGQRPDDRGMAALRHAGEPEPGTCSSRRSRPRACTSTSSRGRSTTTWPSSRPIKTQEPPSRSTTRSGRSMPGRRRHTSPVSFSLLLNLVGGQRHRQGPAVGLYQPLSAGGDPGHRADAGPADGPCAELLRGFRPTDEGLPRADRQEKAAAFWIWRGG
jgi:hypothetical protein